MANDCYFEGKILGKKEEVEEVFKYFTEAYNYNLLNKEEKASDFIEPKGPHFWRIHDFKTMSQGENEKEEFFITFCGICAWSLFASLLYEGYQKSWDEYKNKAWFKGTCLEEVHKKFPHLKMEFFSEEPGMNISEHILIEGDSFINESEDFKIVNYESIEEAKEDGMEISEDMVEEDIYVRLPSWYKSEDNGLSYSHSWNI